MMFKIDYVLLYLDPTDPYWLKQFEKYREYEFSHQPMRYDKDGISYLKYHFRGLAKYMPWLNNVYLVVFSDSQVPDWINRNTVKIVTDDMFIPKKFLPTFNSITKKMYLHNIESLEEHFLVNDDDIFCINNTLPTSFFDVDGRPKVENVRKEKLPKKSQNSWRAILYNSIKFGLDATKQVYIDDPIFHETFQHIPRTMIKSDMKYYYEKYKDIIEQSITPCRSSKNISEIAWSTIYRHKYGNLLSDIIFAEFSWFNKGRDLSVIKEKNRGMNFVNINQNNNGDKFKNEFEIIFKEKCKYERT